MNQMNGTDRSYTYRNSSEGLLDLANLVDIGEEVGSRNGRAMEVTNRMITLTNPTEREIIVSNRGPNLAAQIAETMWVLAGRDDIEWLQNYLPRAGEFSDDGKVWRGAYGKRIRRWPYRDGDTASPRVIDQLRHVIELLREDPLTRRAVIAIYDPQVDTEPGKDIPCNDQLTFTNRMGKLDLHVHVRSNDLFWGWSGINAFEWSVVQEFVARMVGVEVGSLHFSVSSLHIYSHHWGRARSVVRDGFLLGGRTDLTTLKVTGVDKTTSVDDFDDLIKHWFYIEEKIRRGEPALTMINDFPDELLRGWLWVLQYWWTGNRVYLRPLAGTRLSTGVEASIRPPAEKARTLHPESPADNPKPIQANPNPGTSPSDFAREVAKLHDEKHAAYGDSWKRRGEMLGILANIARKVDRLTSGKDTDDETGLDTAIDLLVYLAKYRVWLSEGPDYNGSSLANGAIGKLATLYPDQTLEPVSETVDMDLVGSIDRQFSRLEDVVQNRPGERSGLVAVFLATAFDLAYRRWLAAHAVNQVPAQSHSERNATRVWKGYEQ